MKNWGALLRSPPPSPPLWVFDSTARAPPFKSRNKLPFSYFLRLLNILCGFFLLLLLLRLPLSYGVSESDFSNAHAGIVSTATEEPIRNRRSPPHIPCRCRYILDTHTYTYTYILLHWGRTVYDLQEIKKFLPPSHALRSMVYHGLWCHTSKPTTSIS